MARATFQRGQKVWVECVGAWSTIDRINPVWAKGFSEPVRVTYDVGLGREFLAHELTPAEEEQPVEGGFGRWRLMRAKNNWQKAEDVAHHPYPGTHPVIVTDNQDWGGWRVPGAEYDRDPYKMEAQARLVAASPQLLHLAETLAAAVLDQPEDCPPGVRALADAAAEIVKSVTHSLPSLDDVKTASGGGTREIITAA